MNEYYHILPPEDVNVLTSFIGKRLKCLEGYRYDFDSSSDIMTFYGLVRLHFEDGASYDLSTKLIRINTTDDFWDDAGVFNVSKSAGAIWTPSGISTLSVPINCAVESITLVNDFDDLKHKNELVAKYSFTRAILLKLDQQYLSLTLDELSEDAIVAHFGSDCEQLVPQHTGSWYDHPEWSDTFTRRYEVLLDS